MLSLLACVQTCLLYKKKLDLQSLLDLHNVPFEFINIRDLLTFCHTLYLVQCTENNLTCLILMLFVPFFRFIFNVHNSHMIYVSLSTCCHQ